MRPPPDCLTCGACCVSPFLGEGYIQVNAAEEDRLGRMGLPVLELIDDPEDRAHPMLIGGLVRTGGAQNLF